MADFRPFRSWRYDLEKAAIDQVIAPPYDVISPEEQKALYARSPENCIRLILNQEEPQDKDGSNRYTRARDFFEAWQQKGILTQEKEPCFYYYRQSFRHPVTREPRERSALLGKIKLERFENRIVIPHEKTLSRPRADRRKLLETTRTNFSPIFGLYEYDHGQDKGLQNYLAKPPLFETTDDQGVTHAVWAISDPKVTDGIHKGLADQKIYIADGHHRYQTALEYAEEQRKLKQVPASTELDSDFALMALVHFYDPGLVILPTHRMVQAFASFQPERCLKALAPYFSVEEVSLDLMQRKMHEKSGAKNAPVVMGLGLEDGRFFFLTQQDPEVARKKMPAGKAGIWYTLDVSLVSHLILGALWGLPEEEWESKIRYTHSDEEALRTVREKRAAAVFFLNAPRVEVLRDMGEAKELMPQKSTFFYPKLASGLVFNAFES